jgi:glutamine amidotransferase
MVHPIIDSYYNHNPYHSRSSKFVQDKGLIANEKSSGGLINNKSASPDPVSKKSFFPSSNLHDSIVSSLVPSMHITSSIPSINSTSPSSAAASPAISPHSALIPLPLYPPTLTPYQNREINPNADLRHVTQPAKVQELGNTKKKRRSLSGSDTRNQNLLNGGLGGGNAMGNWMGNSGNDNVPDSPEIRPGAYGDPMKIAQYFPELN